jgi:hypothetical protein
VCDVLEIETHFGGSNAGRGSIQSGLYQAMMERRKLSSGTRHHQAVPDYHITRAALQQETIALCQFDIFHVSYIDGF